MHLQWGNNMKEFIIYNLMTIAAMIMVIAIAHALFFIAYGYIMGGDPFIALMNFYENMYNIRW